MKFLGVGIASSIIFCFSFLLSDTFALKVNLNQNQNHNQQLKNEVEPTPGNHNSKNDLYENFESEKPGTNDYKGNTDWMYGGLNPKYDIDNDFAKKRID